MSESLHSFGPKPSNPLCPLLPPRTCSNSCSLSRWYYLTISSSTAPFSFCPQSFPASGSFPMSQLFASGSQNIRASASAIPSANSGPSNVTDSSPDNKSLLDPEWFIWKLDLNILLQLSQGHPWAIHEMPPTFWTPRTGSMEDSFSMDAESDSLSRSHQKCLNLWVFKEKRCVASLIHATSFQPISTGHGARADSPEVS